MLGMAEPLVMLALAARAALGMVVLVAENVGPCKPVFHLQVGWPTAYFPILCSCHGLVTVSSTPAGERTMQLP